jgi:hypothetical protein
MLSGLILAVLLLPSISFAGKKVVEKYIEPPEQVQIIAYREGFHDFPKPADIVTIARIESSFNPKARNKMSKGIMQVNYGSFDLEKNMISGVKMLRELYLKLGSARSAIIAYNIGIGNFYKKRHMISGNQYYRRFNKHRDKYENFNTYSDSVTPQYSDLVGSMHIGPTYNMADFFSSGRLLQPQQQRAGDSGDQEWQDSDNSDQAIASNQI